MNMSNKLWKKFQLKLQIRHKPFDDKTFEHQCEVRPIDWTGKA